MKKTFSSVLTCDRHVLSSWDSFFFQGTGHRHWSGPCWRPLAWLCHSPRPAVPGWVRSLPPPTGELPLYIQSIKHCRSHLKKKKKKVTLNVFPIMHCLVIARVLQHIMCCHWLIQASLLFSCLSRFSSGRWNVLMPMFLCPLTRVQSSRRRRLQIATASTPWRDIQNRPGSKTSSLMTATRSSWRMRRTTAHRVRTCNFCCSLR